MSGINMRPIYCLAAACVVSTIVIEKVHANSIAERYCEGMPTQVEIQACKNDWRSSESGYKSGGIHNSSFENIHKQKAGVEDIILSSIGMCILTNLALKP